MKRKVSKLGAQYRDAFYTHQRLAPHLGHTVQIAPTADPPARLAIYDRRGELICEAYRQGELPAEVAVSILLERGDLRAHDRKWWRRLLTQIEVDAREQRTGEQASRDESEAGHTLLEALFSRLPLNQPATTGSPPASQPPHFPAAASNASPERDDKPRRTRTVALNQPVPAREAANSQPRQRGTDA